ncbi:MAG TPA: hypothetical protein VF598_06420, partial [Hymenobacter sp.]
MKKIYQSITHKRHNSQRSKRSAIKLAKAKERKKNLNKALVGLSRLKRRIRLDRINIYKKYPNYSYIYAPVDFSFRKNPEQVISFINEVSKHYDNKKSVFIALKNVVEIDYDAIVVLLATMVKFKSENISFNGDFPRNKTCKAILVKSGFL